MTNFTLLTNLFGQRSEKTTRQSGHTLESIVSRFSLVSLICACMLTLGAGNVWGAVVSGTTYTVDPKTPSIPTDWTVSSSASDANYTKLLSGSNYIQTDEFCVSSFSSIKVKARKFGGPSDAQALITVSWWVGSTETVLGTVAPSSTSLTDYTISSPTSITANTEGHITISCKEASNSKGSGVSQVTITYTSGDCSGGTPTSYSVTYNANDATSGTVPSDNTAYSSGATVTVLGNTGSLDKTGYSFGNWNTSADGSGTPYAAGNTFSITGSTTLYAKWTATITLNGNGATTDGSANATVNYKSSSISAIMNPSKTDYIFGGWYSGAGGTGSLVINTNGALQANVSGFTDASGKWTATGIKTLYAKWLAAAGERYQLVTDVSDLESGDEIIILDTNGSCALSTDQRSNNRAGIGSNAAIWTISSNIVTIIDPDQVQVLTISPGSINSSYWQLYTGSGYLYAASSSGNQLKTQATNNVNGEWYITIESSVASIVAAGSSNRNVMQYNYNNNNPPIFTCYEAANQTALKIYKKACNNPGTALSFTLSHSSITTGGSSNLTASGGNNKYKCVNRIIKCCDRIVSYFLCFCRRHLYY